jgi:hypothetical protein
MAPTVETKPQQRCVYQPVAQQWTFILVTLFRLSAATSQYFSLNFSSGTIFISIATLRILKFDIEGVHNEHSFVTLIAVRVVVRPFYTKLGKNS